MGNITKKEFFAALADYPDNAQLIFNDDDNWKALEISGIDFSDNDLAPVLCPETLGPRIFIHFTRHQ